MDIKSLEKELEGLEKQKKELENRLDNKILEFFEQLRSPADSWIRDHIKRKIQGNPKHALELGTEGLGKLRQKMDLLLGQLPEIIDKIKDDKKEWPHKREYSYAAGEPFFTKCFRAVIGNVGVLINEFGFSEGDWRKENGQYRYQYNPGFEENKVRAIDEYKEIKKTYDSISLQVHTKNMELTKAKADELWDSTK